MKTSRLDADGNSERASNSGWSLVGSLRFPGAPSPGGGIAPSHRRAGVLPGLAALVTLGLCCATDSKAAAGNAVPSQASRSVADYAVAEYSEAALATLRDLVAFETVHIEGTPNEENPEFQDLTAYLSRLARELGFDFEDHGAVVVIGLGDAEKRIGVVAHGDVQPADPTRWRRDPFQLDEESEPGRLVGRGTEDDKGPLACALWAMKALKESRLELTRRVELIVTYTEESDWEPIRQFLSSWDPPSINIAFDAEYPVVTAEKGWGQVILSLAVESAAPGDAPTLVGFTGGSFLSQVPGNADVRIEGATEELIAALIEASSGDGDVQYQLERDGDTTILRAHGVSAHSATPWEGSNAITHLANVLGQFEWPANSISTMVSLINELIGTGDNAERFGDLAYSDAFMGPLTLTLATLEETASGLTAGISFRRPTGRSNAEVEQRLGAALDGWSERHGIETLAYDVLVTDPYRVEAEVPHVPVLLGVFRHYTGMGDAQPVSIGGGTNARLLPNGVSFGPSMPGVPYTGHSEHEFLDREQLLLNLQMYSAAIAELAR